MKWVLSLYIVMLSEANVGQHAIVQTKQVQKITNKVPFNSMAECNKSGSVSLNDAMQEAKKAPADIRITATYSCNAVMDDKR